MSGIVTEIENRIHPDEAMRYQGLPAIDSYEKLRIKVPLESTAWLKMRSRSHAPEAFAQNRLFHPSW
jgi:hypothetical protein